MADVPHAPWHLTGECVVGVVRRRRPTVELPAGLRRLRGPALVMAVRYDDTPVGPYVEFAIAEPARLGPRPGLCVTTMIVTSADSRVAGIVNWGLPKERGTLEWAAVDEGVELWWKERSVRVRSQPRGRLAFPGMIPMRTVQRRADGPVVVPGRVRGWARPATVSVEVSDPADPLAAYVGRHPGLQVRGVRLSIGPARVPTGLASTLRAPLQATEPAVSDAGYAARV